jgi:hypothetical protein
MFRIVMVLLKHNCHRHTEDIRMLSARMHKILLWDLQL